MQVIPKGNGQCPSCGHSLAFAADTPSDSAGSIDGVTNQHAENRIVAGKRLTFACFFLLLLIPVVGEVIFIAQQGHPEPVGLIWLALNSLLAFQAWRGLQWPRIAAACVHLGLAAPLAVAIIAEYFGGEQSDGRAVDFAYLSTLGIVLLILVAPSLTLLISRPYQTSSP